MQKLKKSGRKKFAARLGLLAEEAFRAAGRRRFTTGDVRFGRGFLRGFACAAILSLTLRLRIVPPQLAQNLFRQPRDAACTQCDDKIS